MAYVDGFLVAVPTEKREAYATMARESAAIFKEFGAVEILECWGDDVPPGVLTSFPLAVRLAADETVVFAWIKYPSRAVRDAAVAKVMEDPRMQASFAANSWLDGKRMVFGGFEVLVEA